MEALIERHTSRLLKAANEIAEDKGKPVYDRIIQSVRALRMNQSGKKVLEHIHRPQNALRR